MSTAGKKLWASGRSSGDVADITVRMGQSISLDIQLYHEDLLGSQAHARMLERIGIINRAELMQIEQGLATIRKEIEDGELELIPELEDIHTHVETRLIELIGEAGRKLHTARSRNDQIAVDTHLFVRRMCVVVGEELRLLCEVLLRRAEEEVDTVLPGYTHLQVAQPVRLSHHLLAHFWSFERDLERFHRAAQMANRMPLGSGAMAGVNYPTDREFLREQLQFASIYPNSMDAVATRDHVLDYLFACSVFMTRASRLAEELVLWNSIEFGFITLPDELTTGSSIMPQKKNPDLAELARGKTGRVLGNFQNVLINLKSLPLTYNRDLQEDRFPLIDSGEQVLMCVQALREMIDGAVFARDRMASSLERGYATATDLADALVNERGISFRESHHIAGQAVARAVELGVSLLELPAQDRESIHADLANDDFYLNAIDLAASTDRKLSYGSTARERQMEQIKEAQGKLREWQKTNWRPPPDEL